MLILVPDSEGRQLREFNAHHDERGKFAVSTRVGITSYRKPDQSGTDHTDAAVHERMHEMKARLQTLKGVSQVSVRDGRGQWKGGSEPSWIVSYVGNGEARKLMAKYGDDHKQDAVLIMKSATPAKATDSLTEFKFQGSFSARDRRFIDKALAAAKVGGWSWYKGREGIVLRVASVKSWQGDRKRHAEVMAMVGRAGARLHAKFSRTDRGITTETLGESTTYNDTSYESVLRGK